MAETELIRTPDQRLRVFVSSTLRELAAERQAVRDAVTRLRLVPVLFELGARPQPPRQVYRAYLAQSQVFVGVYWQSYGWIAPGEQVSGLEDEYLMAAGLPRLLYVKSPAPEREPRLDGLPLAIELAAARVRMLPPQALLARIDDRLGLLTAGPRDLPERQRTLRSTLDWSFDLLSPPEQALFACLGVFAGPFDLRAVEAVSGDPASSPADPGKVEQAGQAEQAEQAGQVIDTLSSLLDSSLVRQEARTGEPRFSLLETIRDYALQRLRRSADWPKAHDRHAAYFFALAEPAAAEMQGRGQLGWLDRLEAEHDNLWAAMSWLVDDVR
jgi:hypothetical protein